MKRGTEDATNDDGGRKKRVRFDPDIKDNEPEPSGIVKTPKVPKKPRSVDNDGLDILGRRIEGDADEEAEDHEPKRLDIKSVHGQEEATIEYDGSVKIMPFNMKDEEEEGQYDEEGNYVFNKNKEDIRDEWLDNLDWDAAKHKAGDQWNKMEDDGGDSPDRVDGVAACDRILKYLDDKTLAPNEKSTVNDVLKKLNSQKNLSAAEERKRRWDAKKKGIEYKNEFSDYANDLTGAADDLLKLGHMNVYSMTKEEITGLSRKPDTQIDESPIDEELEIQRELAERAARTKKLEEEAQKREASKADTKESLISDLMSDDEGETNGKDVEMTEA